MSSSEASAMIEGVLRHCTEMEVERQFVDSHGQSEVAIAFCRLLGLPVAGSRQASQSDFGYRQILKTEVQCRFTLFNNPNSEFHLEVGASAFKKESAH